MKIKRNEQSNKIDMTELSEREFAIISLAMSILKAELATVKLPADFTQTADIIMDVKF